MGCAPSQHKLKARLTDIKRLNSRNEGCDNSDSGDIVSEAIRKFDIETIRTITKDLNETPELFVLNNVLMAMMFFENYQKDIKDAAKNRHKKLEKCIIPDAMLEKVNQNLTYRPLHGSNKYTPERLITKRIYVADDSIEVFHPIDVPESEQKSCKCQVKIEDCKRKGFVKLQELNSSSIPYDQSNINTIMNEATPSTSNSSSDNESSDTTYENSTLLQSRTPQPIDIDSETEEKNEKECLLNSCFVYRKKKKPQVELDLEEMNIKDITEEDVYDLVSYLTSIGFMKYFRNNLFPNTIGEALGFQKFEISLAKWIPGKVFCNLVDDNDNNNPCEIIPCLRISWPDSQTLQFFMREEEVHWPTRKMLEDIRSLDCALVPKGYVKKKTEHPEADLEWEIHFPSAERYLETFMSHAQIRCLLVLLTLHKTYIEPYTHQHGLLAEHIRTHVYWEIENNYRDWPEHRLGIKLLYVIKNLSRGLRLKRLNDYFVQKKNLFQNIPSRYLEHSNKVFHDILQSPLMYFIKALRNIRYNSGKFYPPLDFKELQRILAHKEINFNPYLGSLDDTRKSFAVGDAEMQLKYAQELRKREQILKQREKEKESKKRSYIIKPMLERRDSVDSIDLEWTCENHFDINKKHDLLVLFATTYLNIAKTSSKIGTHKQTLFYLKQAWYLSKILGSVCPAFEEESDELLAKIRKEEDACNNNNEKPDSEKVVVNENNDPPDLYQQLKKSFVDLHNLNNSYNETRPTRVLS